jgi:hypothetical protein
MKTITVGVRVAAEIAKNVAMGIPPVRKLRVGLGRTARPPEPSQLGHQVYSLFDRVEKYAGSLVGKSVLEIGPGDNIATGLAFLAAGARSYTALDRFPGNYNGKQARAWYRLVRQEWKRPWPASLDAEMFPAGAAVSVIPHSVERAQDLGKFDIVCSHAVGEHVEDVDAFCRLSNKSLATGGVAVHVVDFSGHQWDDDIFMRFPEWLWRAMGSNRGFPNRKPLEAFATLGTAYPSRTEATFVRRG